MRKSIATVFSLLSASDKPKLIQILLVTTSNGVLQALGIASIMPFIALLSDPSLAESSQALIMLKSLLPAYFQERLLLSFGLIALFVLLAGNALAMFEYWFTLRFFNQKEHQLSVALFNRYLGLSLIDFHNKKQSVMSKNLLSELERVAIGTMLKIVSLISDAIVAVAVFIVLLVVDTQITIITTLLLSASYFLIYLLIQNRVNELGSEFSSLETQIFSTAKQALSLFKEAKVANKTDYFIQRYSAPHKKAVINSTHYHVLGYMPLQIVEILAFGLIIGIAVHFSQDESRELGIITSIGVYAFATYRLIPVLKSIFDGLESIEYSSVALERIASDFNLPEKAPDIASDGQGLDGDIKLNDIEFKYPDSPSYLFKGVNLCIPKGQFTCLVGPSGIGKTTLFDIMLGLITPHKGALIIDSTAINHINLAQWQMSIGYVPQQVTLIDDSIASNIAFGVAHRDIDINKVKRAAKIAQIDTFIDSELPEGYQTRVGDGGKKLSGGQKQRIGIARALYHDPGYLFLDEATNELDGETEHHILECLKNLTEKTILFITHKPSVTNRADHIIDIRQVIKESFVHD